MKKLQKKFPLISFEKFFWSFSKRKIEILFFYQLSKIKFTHKISISSPENISHQNIENLIFHLGVAEILNYWKLSASPTIEIKAGFLGKKEISFYRDFFLKGMGEFFYQNKINFKEKKFLNFKISSQKKYPFSKFPLKERYLLAFGGGKDSFLSYEKLKKEKKEFFLVISNLENLPRVQKFLKDFKIKKVIKIKREIDKKILALNKKGFLNGHVPITGILHFLFSVVACAFDFKYVVFSNEKSANEGNTFYLGQKINHQYSKSDDFEKKFKNFSKKFLNPNLEVFSLLRNLYEKEIAKKFSKLEKYFPYFLSCNKGQKEGKWCKNCPKCLFLYFSLYPFLDEKKLLSIFGENLLEKKKFLRTFQSFFDKRFKKPFECVGTKNESKEILMLSLKKAKKEKKVPFLLKKFLK